MLKAGTATKIINNELGTIIQAATCEKSANSIRDDLEANFFFLTDDEHEPVMFINCDAAGLRSEYVQSARKRISKKLGLPERGIIISCTHTHNGPCVVNTNPCRGVDEAWHDKLMQWLCNGAAEAVANARHCRIGYARGHAEIGYNRRCCWKDGSHTMSDNCASPDFTGMEGVQDSRHYVFFAEDENDQIIGIIHNNSAHPTSFYGADFYSADYPGLARKLIREAFPEMERKLPVLYFNGGFGDNTPECLPSPYAKQENKERKYRRQAYIIAGETLRLINHAVREENPVLRHIYEDLSIPVRLPDEEKLAEDYAIMEKAKKAQKTIGRWEILFAYGRIKLWESYKDSPIDKVPIHAIKIGNCAIVTNPCELFGQFMIDVRRRSPFPVTLFADISDGYCGYCPTMSGALSGGYSGEAIYWTRLAFEAGYKIVDTSAKLLYELNRT